MASFAAMLEDDFATIESFAHMTAPSTRALLCPSAASSAVFEANAVGAAITTTTPTDAGADAQAMRGRKRAAATALLDSHVAVVTSSDDSSSGAESSLSSLSSSSSSAATRAIATSSSSSSSTKRKTPTEAPATMPKKKKKPWYAVQKDEIRALEKEAARLQARKELLLEPVPRRRAALLTQQRENEQLREAIRELDILLAQSQSALAGNAKAHAPALATLIHLGSDWAKRAATVARVKPTALRMAEQYITNRALFLDPTLEHAESQSYSLPNGDLCCSSFDILPLDVRATSVRQVFAALKLFLFNLEIAWTESQGKLMVREGDFEVSSGDPDVATQRFVRSMDSGALLESNSVLFCRFTDSRTRCQAGADVDASADTAGASDSGSASSTVSGDSAVMTVHFVDQDDLYPYLPADRMRQDVTAALALREYPRADGSGSVIVLMRASFTRLHQSKLAVLSDVADEIRFGSSFWTENMLREVYATIQRASEANAESLPSVSPPSSRRS